MIIKSVFLQPDFQMPLSLEKHNLFPFLLFLLQIWDLHFSFDENFFLTEIHPGVPGSGAVAYALESSSALAQVSCQSPGLQSGALS